MSIDQSVIPKNASVLCLIPARRDSKGLPGKNVRDFHGKPLIAWTIEIALESQVFSKIAVTSNDETVLQIADSYNVKSLKRPDSLASDSSLASDYLKFHCEEILDHDYLVLMQPTSPLRKISDVWGVVEALYSEQGKETAIVSMTETSYRARNLFEITSDSRALPLRRSQEANRQKEAVVATTNGAFFAAGTRYLEGNDFDFLKEHVTPYLMPKMRSIDIDTLEDFELALRNFKSVER